MCGCHLVYSNVLVVVVVDAQQQIDGLSHRDRFVTAAAAA
jgi:hypothetical protein